MDYLGHSILELKSSGTDPATLAAIVALQAEVVVLQDDSKFQEGQITTLQTQTLALRTDVGHLQDDYKSQEGKITDLQTRTLALRTDVGHLQDEQKATQAQLTAVAATVATLQNDVSYLQDFGSFVLQCPVQAQTATLSIPLQFEHEYFYYYGYAPINSPFVLTRQAGGNFANGTYGLIWTRPTTSQNLGAIFEVDVLATFIPSAFMYVKLAVQVWANAFDSSPMYDLEINERSFAPSSVVNTWSAKMIISVPLKALGQFAQNVTFNVLARRTDASATSFFVIGVGGNYGMQHNLTVKRIH